MINLLRTTLIAVLFVSQFCQAADFDCAGAFNRVGTTGAQELSGPELSKVAEKIKKFRKYQLQKPDLMNLEIGGIKYKILGILGRASSTVYLAQMKDGRLVQIKRISNAGKWANSIFYELTVSRFYQEHGISMPRILDFEFTTYSEDEDGTGPEAVIVREYVEGITGEELDNLELDLGEARPIIQQKIATERQKIAEIHKGFSGWLVAHSIDLNENYFPELSSLIRSGDLKPANLLYSAQLNSVLDIDP